MAVRAPRSGTLAQATMSFGNRRVVVIGDVLRMIVACNVEGQSDPMRQCAEPT